MYRGFQAPNNQVIFCSTEFLHHFQHQFTFGFDIFIINARSVTETDTGDGKTRLFQFELWFSVRLNYV